MTPSILAFLCIHLFLKISFCVKDTSSWRYLRRNDAHIELYFHMSVIWYLGYAKYLLKDIQVSSEYSNDVYLYICNLDSFVEP